MIQYGKEPSCEKTSPGKVSMLPEGDTAIRQDYRYLLHFWIIIEKMLLFFSFLMIVSLWP